ncbi:hypothetical protein Bca101_047155 [Brassica carinata]
MEGVTTCFHTKCVSLPARPIPLSRVSSLPRWRNRNLISSPQPLPHRTLCCSASSSGTLLEGGSPKEEDRQSKVSSKGDDSEDLKLWMDKKAELLTTNKLSELACLALYLMYEKKQGKKSVWYPYIRELDRQRGRGQLDVESPLLWSEAELEYLTGSPTKAEVLERAEGIKREYSELDTVWFMAGSLFQNVSLARRFALVPLGPRLLAYCSNCKAMLTAVDSAVELVVDRAYKAGDPIVAWCGPQPNAKLLLNYGFVDEDNPYDRIIVEAALSTDDPQYQDKRLVAQRKGKLSQQVFQVRVGKEREAVQDMLPYLRLGYMSDPAEMQSVISSQGPVCSMSPCMERAVLDQLADHFMRRLSRYPTTLKEDDALLADPSLNPRKRVATRLVRLEKKMLAACLVATVDFLNELPDTTISPCPALYAPSLK